MADLSVLNFPRVLVETSDPSPAQNKHEGFVEGTIWVNKTTGKIFTLINRDTGTWVILLSMDPSAGGMTFGDGSNQDAHFDLGDGNFIVDANNFKLAEDGEPEFSGNKIILNKNYITGTNPPDGDLAVMRGDLDSAHMKWQGGINAWLGGTWNVNSVLSRLFPLVNTVNAFSRDPLPTDNCDAGYFIGQQWVNMATGKTFVCSQCPVEFGLDATWREVLTDAAPTTTQVQSSDFFILYNSSTKRYSEIVWSDFVQFIIDAVGGTGPSTIGYGWVTDASGDIAPSSEDPIANGLFEDDGTGDLTPLVSPSSDPDVFFELDGNDDLTLQSV